MESKVGFERTKSWVKPINAGRRQKGPDLSGASKKITVLF